MSQQYPKITIITPSYNQGSFIRETIESVLSQGYPNLEYIVMDGGSTDNTLSILKSYGKKIIWTSKKDHGQTDAINKGIKKSTGDIIAYLNSDDVYLPNTLFTIAEYFISHGDAQWVTGDYFIIDAQGNKIQSFVEMYKRVLRIKPTFEKLCVANYIIQPSTFWRRSIMKKVGLFDDTLRYCMDYDYWMRLISISPPHILSSHLSLFRIHIGSKGGSQYAKQFGEEHEIVRKYTSNPLLLIGHKLHANAIVTAYNFMKASHV